MVLVRSGPMQIFVATALVVVAFLLRLLILPVDAKHPYCTFYPASILAFLWCGRIAGAWAVLLSLFFGYYVFSAPVFSLQPTFESVVAAALFSISTALIGWIVDRLAVALRVGARQQARLALDEERYRHVVQDQSEVICRYLADGTFTFVNDAFCRMFGGSADKYIGHAWHPMAHPDDIPDIQERLGTLSPTNPVVTIENRVYVSDGSLRWGQFVNRAFFNTSGALVEMQAVGRDITDRKLLEDALAQKTAALEDLYENAPCGYHSLDASGTYVKINATELSWLGATREEIVGKCSPLEFFTDEGRELFRRTFPTFKVTGRLEGLEFDLVGRHGVRRRVSLSATMITDPNRRLESRSVLFDITESHRLSQQVKALVAEQGAMLDNELVGIVRLVDRQVVWANRAVERMFGYGTDELIGQPTLWIYLDDASFERIGREAYPVLEEGGNYRGEMQFRRKDGRLFWANIYGTLVSPEKDESLWLIADVTNLKEREEQAHFLATHDALTGLPNRRGLDEYVAQAAQRAARAGTFVAAAYIDLDGLKAINDGSGHQTGDQVLLEVAQRMRQVLRDEDLLVRFGGDEFVMIVSDLPRPGDAMLMLKDLATTISEPIVVPGDRKVHVTASIGVAVYPVHCETPSELLKIADEAMFFAKERGGTQIFQFPIENERMPTPGG